MKRRVSLDDLLMLIALRDGGIVPIVLPKGRRIVKRLARGGLVQAIGDGSIARITNRGAARLKELAALLYEEP